MTCTNTTIMAEEVDKIAEFHESGAEGLPWLPTYILNDGTEAIGDSGEDDYRLFSKERNYSYKHRHQPPSGRKSPAAAQPPLLPSPPHWKNYSKPDQKTKYPTKWAAGGPGMQAVFLASGQRSGGTGVFLPRTVGTDVEKPRKPAFAPILLPSRVVQALNLNVHGLGLQIKPREHSNNVKGLECDRIRTKKNRDMSNQICVLSQNRSSSPEIFLPKEWTY
ncbi:hypothetical protein L1987_03797 [Smallanthus sonchifolius]|uniref:Uncharacterized protein n=1 Tax=Smallanthus sonchifolius TaxID=185202 RepID=A0ACB9KBN5_9ASTR|nr:hypothetical protein L1987_03797 [Smallanthus sonchifolius]